MHMDMTPEMSQDPVAEAIMLPSDDPERLPAIIAANQQQQSAMREFIQGQFTEHDAAIAGYLNRFTQDVNQVLEAHFSQLYADHKAITGSLVETKISVNNALQGFLFELKAEIETIRRENETRYLDLESKISTNTEDIQRIKAHLGL